MSNAGQRQRQLVYFVAVSLDGLIAGPGGDFSAFPVEGDHIEMLVREYPDTLPGPALTALGITAPNDVFDTVVMGWNTYAVGLPHGVDDPYPHLRQFVCSRSRTDADAHPDVTVTATDPVSLVEELKAEPGGADIWLCGGGQLAATLAGAIDRLVLKVNPLLLGSGIPLFQGPVLQVPEHLALTSSRPFASGVVVNEYQRVR